MTFGLHPFCQFGNRQQKGLWRCLNVILVQNRKG